MCAHNTLIFKIEDRTTPKAYSVGRLLIKTGRLAILCIFFFGAEFDLNYVKLR